MSSKTFQKVIIVGLAFLAVIFFQNCNLELKNSTNDKESKSVHQLYSFELLLLHQSSLGIADGEHIITEISAQPDSVSAPSASDTMTPQFAEKFIVSKRTKKMTGKECATTYSVTRDDIRPLARALEDLKIHQSKEKVHIDGANIYALKVNEKEPVIFLGALHGSPYTLDVELSDFEKALEQNEDKVISFYCTEAR